MPLTNFQILVITLNVILFSYPCYSSRILAVMPYASASHKNTMVPLVLALADRGHHITFISGRRTEQLTNVTNVREIVVDMEIDFTVPDRDSNGKNFFEGIVEQPTQTKLAFLKRFQEVPEISIASTFSDYRVKEMLRNEHFDLVLNSIVTAYVGYPFAWHFNCPFILVSPNVIVSDLPFVIGDSEHTEYVPFMLASFTNRMSLFERTINTALVHVSALIPKYFHTPSYDRLIQHFLPGCPPIYDIERNVSLIFTNTHPSFSYPRASPPSLIEIGAIQCRPAQPLPNVFENFIESAGSHGFLVFAVGSVIRMDEMPSQILGVFKRVFARLPYRVIWQWKSPTTNVTMPSNVMLSSWLPQQDLLGHPKCRGFITHGGLLSTQEAVYHGVPVIGIPFVTDQENNMVKAVADGYAIKLSWNSITEENLYSAILSLLSEPRYNLNVKRLQSLLLDQPETPLKRAVYWSEYVLRNKGAPALQLGSRDLSRLQRNLIDVYCVLFAILVCLGTVFAVIVRRIGFTFINTKDISF